MADVTIDIFARNMTQAALRQVQKDFGGLDDALKKAQSQLRAFGDNAIDAGVKLKTTLTDPIVNLAKAGIMAAADFETSMNQIEVSVGATEEQMAAMQETALRLGRETTFSAGEAAQAMLELTKAGLGAQQSMDALPGVLALAAAGDMDLADAAALTAAALNTFQLEASESDRIANLMANAANESAASMTDLADGMKQAGFAFNATNQDIDDMVTSLAILTNVGLTGSDAGTALKNAQMRLMNPTAKAAELMKQLGIEVYDANGQMKAWVDVIAEFQSALYGANEVVVTTGGRTQEQGARMAYLQKQMQKINTELANYQSGLAGVAQSEQDKIVSVDRLNRQLAAAQAEYNQLAGVVGTSSTVLKTLTEEERNAALATIFLSDGMKAMIPLLEAGPEGFLKMKGAIQAEGGAVKMAMARMSGLNGAMEYFKGTVESLLIETFLPFLDSMSGGIRIIADWIAGFSDLDQSTKNVILGVAAFAAALGPLLIGLGMASNALAGLLPIMKAMRIAMMFALGPVGLLLAALGAFAFIKLGGFKGISEKLGDLGVSLDKAYEKAKEVAPYLKRIFGEVWAELSGQGMDSDRLVQAVMGLGATTGAAVTIDTKAKVITVDWGVFTYTYDAKSGITSVNWGSFLFTYDALAQIAKLDWKTSAELGTFKYDALAGIVSIDWTGALDTGGRAAFSYDSNAGIKSVDWNEENFTFNYNATAGVTKVDFGEGAYKGSYAAYANVTSVLWGAYQHFYSANATIINVAWGAYIHYYDAQAQITSNSVLWGAWSHSYNAKAEIGKGDVLWGLWSYSYNATAVVAEDSVFWGLYTHTYNGKVEVTEDSILWGLFTHTYDAAANASTFTILGKTPSDFFASAFNFELNVAPPKWIQDLQDMLNGTKLKDAMNASLLTGAGGAENTLAGFKSLDFGSMFKMPDWLANFEFPDIPELTSSWWPAISELGSDWWPTITELGASWWPDIPSLGSDWWPEISVPGWVSDLLNWSPFGGADPPAPGGAVGTSSWRGGRLWVGETGPEMVALPRGSRIFSNSESMELATANAGPQIVIQQMVVRSDQDIYAIAYELDDLKRRQRSRRR